MSVLSRAYFFGPALALMLVMTVISMLPLTKEASSVPVDWPVSLSGGFATEVGGDGIYVDHLQPQSSENYLLRFENRDNFQVRYRVDLSNIPSGWKVFFESGGRSAVVDLDPLASRSMYIYVKNTNVGSYDILMNVTKDGSPSYWNIILRLNVQQGPVLVQSQGAVFTVGRTSPVEFDVKLTNIGTHPENISLSMDRMALSDKALIGTWTYWFEPRTLTLGAGQNRTVRGVVRASETEKLGAQYISQVTASVEGIARPFVSSQLTFRVSTIYDLKVSVTPPGYQKVSPGSSFQFTVELLNLADDTDYVLISEFEKPTDWSVGWNDTIDPTSLAVSISPESAREFHPVVFTSPTAIAGRHKVVLRAKGTGNLSDIVLPVEIGRKDAFEMRSILPPGSSNTYKLITGVNTFEVSLRNLGNYYDTATVELLSAPAFAQIRPVHVRVGAGSVRTVPPPTGLLNLSGLNDDMLDIRNWTGPLKLAFSPGETAALGLTADGIDPATDAVSGKLVLKYTYGTFSSSRVLELELKVVLSDVEVLSTDSDSIPDLNVHPFTDLKVGDRVYFTFSVKNNYPLPTRGLEWSISLSGVVLTKGDLGEIGPGETKDFNVSWKANRPTRTSNPAVVRVMGRGYTDPNTAPSARTDEPLYIKPAKGGPAWGLIILFAGFMTFLIVALIVSWSVVQARLRQREEEERRRYETLYGPKKRGALGPPKGRGGGALASSKGQALPSARPSRGMEPDAKAKREGRRARGPTKGGGRGREGPKKKEELPKTAKEEGPTPSDREGETPSGDGSAKVLEAAVEEDMDELAELEDIEELEE